MKARGWSRVLGGRGGRRILLGRFGTMLVFLGRRSEAILAHVPTVCVSSGDWMRVTMAERVPVRLLLLLSGHHAIWVAILLPTSFTTPYVNGGASASGAAKP